MSAFLLTATAESSTPNETSAAHPDPKTGASIPGAPGAPEVGEVGDVAREVARDLERLESAPPQGQRGDEATGAGAPLDFRYDRDFAPDAAYRASLPDLQNGAPIEGAPVKLERVGIHNFRLPIKYRQRGGGRLLELETAVTGTVSLDSCTKGINMSRIIRTFYKHSAGDFTIDTLARVLRDYKRGLNSFEAQLALQFSYPIAQPSLRSGLAGTQYYDVTLEMEVDAQDQLHKTLHLDFVYSSACPCSFELSEHARRGRNKASVPHSQRSVARVSVKFETMVWIEDLRDLCARALQTETQVMVKREDEQAFAELNGAYLKFVEDAVRLLFRELEADARFTDFRIVCCHLESLHSHDAVAVAAKGVPGGFSTHLSHHEFRSLLK